MADQKLTQRTALTNSNSFDEIHVVRHNESYRSKVSLLQGSVIADTTVGNSILSGGGVTYTGTGLDYFVGADSYIINNVVYNIPVSNTVTLSDGHATLDRFDVFAIQITSLTTPVTASIVVVEGTASATPLEPSLDLINQVKVGLRLVPAAETTDTTTTVDAIYNENIEWTNTTLPTGATLTDATSPYSGLINFLTPATSSDSVSWTDSGLTTFNSEDSLSFAFRTILQEKGGIEIKLINSSTNGYYLKTLNYSELNNFTGVSGNESLWVLAQVKLSDFQPSSWSLTQYDRIEITFRNTAQFELDKIEIQGDLTQSDGGIKFTDLSDTPSVYVGQGGKIATVKADETGVEFTSQAAGTLLTTKVTIPTAQVLTLNSTPRTIITNTNGSTAINILSAKARLVFNTTAYSNVQLNLITDNASVSQGDLADLTAEPTTTISKFSNNSNGNASQLVAARSLKLRASANPTLGDSDIDIYVTYELVTL